MKCRTKNYLIAVLVCGCTLTSCHEQTGQRNNAVYKTISVSLDNAVLYDYYSAAIQGVQNVEIRPQVSGLITEICIAEGAKVSKGATLFIIDQVPYKAAVETAVANVRSAESRLATARLTAESKRELYNGNVISEFDLQTAQNSLLEAEASLAQAKAEEVNARNNLSYTVIKSPVDGVASMIPYKVGALVSSSITEPLVTVSNQDRMYAYFSITENQLLELAEEYGNTDEVLEQLPPVELELSNGKPYGVTGKIDAISGTIAPQTGAIGVRAVFDNPKRLLRNGGSARVILPYQKKDCIIIPKTATFEIQDKVYVYKVIDGKTVSAEIHPFKISNGTQYVVESGLEPGEVIIAEGAGLLREDTPVNTHPQVPAAGSQENLSSSSKQ